jgi:hypothetical protein
VSSNHRELLDITVCGTLSPWNRRCTREPALTQPSESNTLVEDQSISTHLAWTFWTVCVLLTLGSVVLIGFIRPHDLGGGFGLGIADALGELLLLLIPAIGALIALRRPENRIGWLFLGIGLAWSVVALVDSWATYALLANPGVLPGGVAAAWLMDLVSTPTIIASFTWPLLLFPNGHLPSPRWRWLAWLTAAVMLLVAFHSAFLPGKLTIYDMVDNPLGLDGAETLFDVIALFWLAGLAVAVPACALAAIARLRRSTGIERMQLKWFAWASGIAAVSFAVAIAITATSSIADWWAGLIGVCGIMAVPVAAGIAILRYRLYAIDRVINRTLVYALLTACLVALYAGAALLLGQLLEPLTPGSDLAIAGSTLLVAALARPARERVQITVDRRFYRHKYDAERTVDLFSARLRGEVDLEMLTAELRAVVQETMQPEYVSIWIRDRA